MNRRYLYFALLLFASVSLYAQKQQHAIDLLLKDLDSEHYRKDDSNRVKQLIRLAWAYTDIGHPDTSLQYSQRALGLALQVNWNIGIQSAYEAMGEIYLARHKNEQALQYYEKAIAIGKERGDYGSVTSDMTNTALIYYQMGDYKKSLQKFSEALKITGANGYTSNTGHILNGMGLCYEYQGYYLQALEYHLKALQVFTQIKDTINIAASYINIANAYISEGDPYTALKNYDSALKINEEIENVAGIADCYGNMGSVYQQQQDFGKSLKYFRSALELSYNIEDKNLAAKLMGNMGTTYYAEHQYKTALKYFDASLKILNEQGDKASMAECHDFMADCYLAITHEGLAGRAGTQKALDSDTANKDVPAITIPAGKAALLNEAFDHYQAGLAISREINALASAQHAYEGLAAAYKQNQSFKKALDYADSARTIKDSLFSKANNEKFVRVAMKNDYDNRRLTDSLKNMQDLQVANFKLQKQKGTFYAAACVFILVIVLIIVLQRGKTARAKSAQQALFSRQLLETELRALRAQMNPHFIFNSLNSIQAFILRENKTEAAAYLQKFSRLIRMILDNAQKTSNTIEEEAEILRLYLDIEKLRLKDKFDFEIKMPPDADTAFTQVPTMVLQPLAENSIWHGFPDAAQPGRLNVEFIREKNKLICIVEDNGIGMHRSKDLEDTRGKTYESRGLKLIEARLQAWSQEKGLQYTFKIFDNDKQGSGTIAEVTILYPYA